MTRKHALYWLAFGVLLIGLAGYLLSQGEVIVLRSDGPLPVGRDPYRAPEGGDLAYTLGTGERAEVIECENTKSDILVRVKVASGETGYIGSGQYRLKRQRASLTTLLSNPTSVIFSCKGLFEHRSEYVN